LRIQETFKTSKSRVEPAISPPILPAAGIKICPILIPGSGLCKIVPARGVIHMKCREAIIRTSVAALAPVLLSVLTVAVFAQERQEKTTQQDQQPTLKIGTTLITVPVIVTDRFGRFTTGLNRSDFSVREDGVVQRIEEFSSTETPFNVALLIDTSRSTQNKLSAIRKAALTFIKQLQPNDRVMIATFDERVHFISDFTNDSARLQQAVKSVKSSYLTSLYDAIYLTITEKMDKIQGRKAIVVLTDGVDTASKLATFKSALDLVASAGIISYAIQYETRNDGGRLMKTIYPNGPNGFSSPLVQRFDGRQDQEPKPASQASQSGQSGQSGSREGGGAIINLPRPAISVLGSGVPSKPEPPPESKTQSKPPASASPQAQAPLRDRYLIASDFLRSLAAQSGARYIRAENIENTSYAFQLIAVELRNQYTLTYISTNEQRDGSYRSIAVSVNRGDSIVRARLGYRASKAEPTEESNQSKP
jgi:VWFA-related protein